MKRLLNAVISLFSWVILGLGITLLVGINFYWLALSLNAVRWFFVILSFGFIFWTWKLKFKKRFWAFIFLASFLITHWIWLQLHYTSLEKQEGKTHQLSVMSYNVFFKNKYAEQVLTTIKQKDPDILLIQELTPNWKSKLTAELGSKYPYTVLKPLKGTHGIGVFSKFKISNVSYINNSSGLPIAQVMHVYIKGKTLQLVNVHLASPSRAVEKPAHFFEYMTANAALREIQWKTVLQQLDKLKTDGSLVMGDANTMPYEPVYHQICKELVDAQALAGKGFGWTFPNTAKIPFAFLRLDYAFLKGKISPTLLEVIEKGSSDHFPIVLELSI